MDLKNLDDEEIRDLADWVKRAINGETAADGWTREGLQQLQRDVAESHETRAVRDAPANRIEHHALNLEFELEPTIENAQRLMRFRREHKL
jgi:hypothetical protein